MAALPYRRGAWLRRGGGGGGGGGGGKRRRLNDQRSNQVSRITELSNGTSWSSGLRRQHGKLETLGSNPGGVSTFQLTFYYY